MCNALTIDTAINVGKSYVDISGYVEIFLIISSLEL